MFINYPQIEIAAASLPDGISGAAYPGGSFSATGGDGTYSWRANTGLPPGLSLSASGVLSGIPTAAGTFTISVTVIDAESSPQVTSGSFTVVINPAQLPPEVSAQPGRFVPRPTSCPTPAPA
jgi:hypothetical protein